MFRITRFRKIKLKVIVSAAALIICVFYLYIPLMKGISGRREVMIGLAEESEQAKEGLKILQYNGFAEKRLAGHKQIPAVIDALSLAAAGGLIEFRAAVQNELKNPDGNGSLLQLDLRVKGGLEQLGGFLALIREDIREVITLDKLRIVRDDGSEDNINASLVLNIHIAE